MHATIPKGIVGGFEPFTVFQRNLTEWHAEAMDVCLRVLKESNKSRFDSYSRQEQCIDHISYYLSGLSRAHFSDNLSRNSCIHNGQNNKQLFFSLEFVNIFLQIEAKAVKMRLHFFNSAVIANSKMDYCFKM